MECPFCHKEIPGKHCARCGALVPAESAYCMDCGASLEAAAAEEPGPDDDLDLENRVLCPDGSCTGIIVDGRCSECGRPADSTPP